MPARNLPVRPDLTQLKHQAKDLLRAVRRGDVAALADFAQFHPERIDPAQAKLADAQLVLARSYQAASWPRLVQACELIEAIWKDDVKKVRALLLAHPHLIREHATIRNSNWGPPLDYAANIGRDTIIKVIRSLDPELDLTHAIDRATLQGRIETARMLHQMAGLPKPPDDALGGPAYTLSVAGTAFLFEIGAQAVHEHGNRLAPVDVVLESDSRKPEAKHAILEMYAARGVVLPDTPTMALHRGRLDLLEQHLARDPGLLSRTFTHQEIYPPDLGCHDELLAVHGTPLHGTTLLHMCVDYDELDIARWLLARGMDVNARAAVDAEGWGGHTALHSAVVSQPNFWMNYQRRGPFVAPFAQLLLDHGADPNARASLRKRLGPGYDDDRVTECRDVTPLGWGERFHNRLWVSEPAMRLIRERGGHS
jgi:ankyrin repeat protein